MLLHDMQRMKADIILLQKKNTLPILKNRFYPTVYHSTYSEAKSRGVSILISAKTPWTHIDTNPVGCYLFLKWLIGVVWLTFANLYVPNDHQDTFLKRHLAQLERCAEEQLIIGGDLNIPLTPSEDTFSGKSSSSCDTRKRILTVLHATQLIDAWRLFHPGERDYTYYSRPHQTYSRIDYFLIPHGHLQAIKGTTIGYITWSDHGPITMRYALSDMYKAQRKPWRKNESLLQDPEVLADVVKEIGHCFHTNSTFESDMGVVWEAHKAVVRGVLIKHGSRIKRPRTAQLTSLLHKLQTLETRHKQTPSRQLDNDLDTTRKHHRSVTF